MTGSATNLSAYLQQSASAVAQYIVGNPISQQAYLAQDATGVAAYIAANPTALDAFVVDNPGVSASTIDAFVIANPSALKAFIVGNPTVLQTYLTSNPPGLQAFLTGNPISVSQYLASSPTDQQAFVTANAAGISAYITSSSAALEAYLGSTEFAGDSGADAAYLSSGGATVLQAYLQANPTSLQQYLSADPDALQGFLDSNNTALAQYLASSATTLQQYLTADPTALGQYLTANATTLQQFLTGNPTLLQQFLTADPALLQTFAATLSTSTALPSLSQFLTSSQLSQFELNVTLPGSGNEATGGLFSSFDIGSGGLFTESLTASQLAMVTQGLASGVAASAYEVNVTAEGSGNTLVGGALANYTVTGSSGDNNFIIEDGSLLGLPAGTAIPAGLGGTFNGSGAGDSYYFVGGASATASVMSF